MRCAICSAAVERMLLRRHRETSHPDYVQWTNRLARIPFPSFSLLPIGRWRELHIQSTERQEALEDKTAEKGLA